MNFLSKRTTKRKSAVVNDTAQVNPVVQQMQNGTKFVKIKENHSKTYTRTFKLSSDGLILEYHPTKKAASTMKIPVQDIHEVRTGYETDTFKNSKIKNKYTQELCLSLIVGAENRTINLVAPTKEAARLWAQGLGWAQKQAQNIDIKQKQAVWIKEAFEKADRNKNGSVDFDECLKLLKSMNIKMDRNHAKKLFEEADIRTHTTPKGKTVSNALDADEFISFYRLVTRRPELVTVFQEYAGEDDYWTLQEFVQFMHEEMKRLQVKREWCKEVIEKYEPSVDCRKRSFLSFDGFQLFMRGPNGLLFNPSHSQVYQDMKQPLCHYFINSSHNTYLMKDQLRGPSSTEAYVRALQRGCRCVELDCWDGPDKEPIIYHGHTFTSKIKFRETLEAIEKYAFTTSDYPLILSLENHCSIEQQKVMAKHLRDVMGDFIYLHDITDDQTSLPSPEDLKGKIIIKNKKLPKAEGEDDGDVSDEDEAAEMESTDADIQEQLASKEKKESKKGGKTKLKLAREISDLVNVCKSVHFKSFQHSKENHKCNEMVSLGENKAFDLAKNSGQEMAEHNTRFLTRIYPGGLRTNSSNYNPMKMWSVGSQIVALNYQTNAEELHLNLGKFQQNGNCGFILKPVTLRKANMQFNPNSPGDQYTQKLTLKIISGQQLPKPSREVIDPYVKVIVLDVNAEYEEKTEVIDNNGFNPEWNHTLEFEIKAPELAMLRFVVYDHDRLKDDFIAQYSIPIASIQLGYHRVPLFTSEGDDLDPAALFVHTLMSAP